MALSCLIVFLAAHLLCVSVGSAGPLICVWLDWREARGDELAGRVGRRLASVSAVLLAGGAVLGFLVGRLLWDEAYRQLLTAFEHKIRMAVWELVFSGVLLAVYAAWRAAVQRPRPWLRRLRMSLPLLASANLLYHFPVLFSAIIHAGAGEAPTEGPFEGAAFRGLLVESGVIARAVHFNLAAVAVVGVAMVVHSLYASRKSLAGTGRVATWGGRIALAAALLDLPVGLWILMRLPIAAQDRALGGDAATTVLVGLTSLSLLWLIYDLSGIAVGAVRRLVLVRTVLLTILVALLMTAAGRLVSPNGRSDDPREHSAHRQFERR